MQVITFNVTQGPAMQDMEDRLYPAVTAEIQIGEDVCNADFTLPDASAAAKGESEGIGAVCTAINGATKHMDMGLDALEWLIEQILMVLRVIMPHMREGRILRVVEDLRGLDGRHMGLIRLETPVWRHSRFGNWRQRRIDEKRFYSGLVTDYFDRDDARLFLLAPDVAPRVEHEFAFGITAEDAHAEGILDSVRGINAALPGDLAQYAPRVREAADVVSRMAEITRKVVRIYDVIRDSDGTGLAAYHIEAPYLTPDPDSQFPTDVWIDGVFRPQAREVA